MNTVFLANYLKVFNLTIFFSSLYIQIYLYHLIRSSLLNAKYFISSSKIYISGSLIFESLLAFVLSLHQIFKKTEMKRFLLLTAIFLSFFGWAQKSPLTQTIKGTVIDDQSGNNIENVTVFVEDVQPAISGVTDAKGNFKLVEIPIGRRMIRAKLNGYEDAFVSNIEVTSSKEVVIEIRMKEKIQKLNEVIIQNDKQKNNAVNRVAVVSARQFSVDEAVRYAGSRNDPSRMAQNFAGVSGSNDARNDIIIRGNSPSGVLWRMEGIDIPNPNHYSTLGSTGGPVTILNTNTLKNSDFITSAFPSQYGNALAGVFDLRMRNGNSDKFEFLGQMGFNGLEFGAEGPLSKKSKSSFLVNYRYSLVSTIQQLGLDVGTGSATPYFQDVNFKVNLPTEKWGTFSVFGIGGESHIKFDAIDKDNLYSTKDGSLRDRNFVSMTGVIGINHTYFYNPTASGKIILAVSGTDADYKETFYNVNPGSTAFYKKNTLMKYSVGYTFNKKFSSKNQFTAGVNADMNQINLRNDYIPDGTSGLITFVNSKQNATLFRNFVNYSHRFNDKLSSNLGVYHQLFTLNNAQSIEPRWNIKYQMQSNQSISFGAGAHSQVQPLEVYFYETKNPDGTVSLTNKNLSFTRSGHSVLGYDVNFSKKLRFKTEAYAQYIYNAAAEQNASSFSMLNSGADFYFPDKTHLTNSGTGYNYGLEMTLERFLDEGFYYLITASAFESKYKGSDGVLRNTAFNSNYTTNVLCGKEFKINEKTLFGLDTKVTYAGGQRYTPFDTVASSNAGFIVMQDNQAYSLQNDPYFRWDFKISYTRNKKKFTQKWYLDFQNLTNHKNIYLRTLNPSSGKVTEIYQIGFFPNINYKITF